MHRLSSLSWRRKVRKVTILGSLSLNTVRGLLSRMNFSGPLPHVLWLADYSGLFIGGIFCDTRLSSSQAKLLTNIKSPDAG